MPFKVVFKLELVKYVVTPIGYAQGRKTYENTSSSKDKVQLKVLQSSERSA